MKKSIMMLLLAAMSMGAMAEWQKIGINDGDTQYVDSGTIRADGNMVKAWTLIDSKTPKRVGTDEAHLSMKIHEEYDCAQAKFRMLSVSTHTANMGQGRVIGFSNDPTEWVGVPPDSFAALKLHLLCGKK